MLGKPVGVQVFYTGVNSTHNGKQAHGAPRQVIMWAATDSLWA